MKHKKNTLFTAKKSLIAGVASVLMLCVAFGVAGCKSGGGGDSSESSSAEQEMFYTVSFETNGGSAVNSVTVKAGETITLGDYIPEKAGFYFYGWSLDEAFTARANNLFVVEENVTLYAEWGAEEKYLLSFETNGGSAIEPVLYYPNAYLAAPEAPTKANYVFAGWYKDAELTKEFSFNAAPQMPSKAMTIYAKWESMNAIVFNTNGGNVIEPIYGAVGDPVDIENPTKDGYIFDGWYADKQCTTPYEVTMVPSGIVTVYAKWHAQAKNVQVTLHVNYNGLDLTQTLTGDEGDEMDVSAAVAQFTSAINVTLVSSYLGDASDLDSKPIYNLGAWAYDVKGSNRFAGGIPAASTDLYAVWTRSSAYCKVAFVDENSTETSYYVKKDTVISSSVLDTHMQAAKNTYEALGCKVDGFYTAGGNRYVAGDAVAMDMRLTPYVYSADLSYEYMTVINSSGAETKGYALKGYAANKAAEYQAKNELMLLIPEYYNDGAHGQQPVIWIADNAFNGFNVSSVTMPASVVGIGENAFKNSALTEVTIPSKVYYLGNNVFSGSSALATVNFDGQVSQLGATVFSGTAYEQTMPRDTSGAFIFFDNRYEIIYSYIGTAATVETPSTARTIGGGAFKNNTTVKTLKIGDSIRYVSDYAFENSAVEKVTIGKFFASMGKGIFKNCANLTSVEFTSQYNLSSIGESMFEGCVSLKDINISQIVSLKEFKARAFFGCSSLEKVQVTNNFLQVGESAFEGCTSLISAEFGTDDNAQFNLLGARAFAGCTALQRVILRGALINNQIVTFKAGIFASTGTGSVAPILYVKDTMVDNWRDDDDYEAYTYVQIYQMRLPQEYRNMDIRAIDAKAPDLTLTPVQMTASGAVDLLAYLMDNGALAYADDTSAAEDCVVSILSVTHESGAAVQANNGKYDMSRKGAYLIVVMVEDEFGNVSEGQITLTVV